MHSPSFVGEPQCNGVIERFIRTLKEQCLWLHRFETFAEARTIIGAFIRRYNEEWIIERLDYRNPGHRPPGAGSGGLTKATVWSKKPGALQLGTPAFRRRWKGWRPVSRPLTART